MIIDAKVERELQKAFSTMGNAYHTIRQQRDMLLEAALKVIEFHDRFFSNLREGEEYTKLREAIRACDESSETSTKQEGGE
jgi:hypothetical protein